VEGSELGRNREAIQHREVGATTPDLVILSPPFLLADEESLQFLVSLLGGADPPRQDGECRTRGRPSSGDLRREVPDRFPHMLRRLARPVCSGFWLLTPDSYTSPVTTRRARRLLYDHRKLYTARVARNVAIHVDPVSARRRDRRVGRAVQVNRLRAVTRVVGNGNGRVDGPGYAG